MGSSFGWNNLILQTIKHLSLELYTGVKNEGENCKISVGIILRKRLSNIEI